MNLHKMLQVLIDGQKNLQSSMYQGFQEVNSRIDRLGKQLNILDDDAPTHEEFKHLEKRVSALENEKMCATQ